MPASAIGVSARSTLPIDAAQAAIAAYDEAWLNADCDALADATTATLRNHLGYDDCAAFIAEAKDFREAERDYAIAFVSKRLRARQGFGGHRGVLLGPGRRRLVDHVTYTVVKDGDTWRIDAIDFGDDDGGNGPKRTITRTYRFPRPVCATHLLHSGSIL